MRLNDRTLSIFTGMFLTISVSTIAQYGDALMASFRGERDVHAVDDIYTIRKGTAQRFKVLLNDVRVAGIKASDLRLTSQPGCGRVERIGMDFAFFDNESCTTSTSFTYCISTGVICEPARVTLRLPRDPQDARSVASRGDTGLLDGTVTETLGDQMRLNRAADDAGTILPSRLRDSAARDVAGRFVAEPSLIDTGDFARPDKLVRVRLATGDFEGPKQPHASAAGVQEAARGHGAVFTGTASSPQGPGCAPRLQAIVQPGAMIGIELRAQCHPMSRVTVVHEGLTFTYRTSALGNLRFRMPAMNPDATIAFRFDDGAAATVQANVPQVSGFAREAIAWIGGPHVALRATEAPGTGDERILTTDRPTAKPAAGRLFALGDGHGRDAGFAQVYSVSHADARRLGGVRLSVELRPAAESCERQFVIRTTRRLDGGPAATSEALMRMPECGATGPVVLDDFLPAIAIAAR